MQRGRGGQRGRSPQKGHGEKPISTLEIINFFQSHVSRREREYFSFNLVFQDENEKVKIISQGRTEKMKLILTRIFDNENSCHSLEGDEESEGDEEGEENKGGEAGEGDKEAEGDKGVKGDKGDAGDDRDD